MKFQEPDKKPKKPKRGRLPEESTPEWVDFSLKPVKQVPKEVEDDQMETVELKPLSETEEETKPEDHVDRKPEQPDEVGKTPKKPTERDEEKPDKKPKKKKRTRRRETPEDVQKAEEAELTSEDEQVSCDSCGIFIYSNNKQITFILLFQCCGMYIGFSSFTHVITFIISTYCLHLDT